MHHRTLPLLLCAALVLAGCTASQGTPQATDDQSGGSAPLAGEPVPANATMQEDALATKNATFGWIVGASASPVQKAVQAEVGDRLVLEVPNGTTRLVADAAWRCTAALCDATGIVYAGADNQEFVVSWPSDAAQASGAKALQLTLTDPEPGPHTLVMVSTDVSAIILGDLRLTAYG